MYAHGLHVTPHISGGQPFLHAFQHINGLPTPLRRSGGYHADSHALDWNVGITDDTWYLGTNPGLVINDFYFIALHETGHVLTFNPCYPVFRNYKPQGYAPAVVSYHGTNVG